MEVVFHHPPELTQLLIEAIPLLCRSKRDVLLFFKGAGVPEAMRSDLEGRLRSAPKEISKYEIARQVLTRLNEAGDSALATRREVVRRVVEYEDFSTCWPGDELKAKGLVAEIRRVVDVKDSFARMAHEREKERSQRLAQAEAERQELVKRNVALEQSRRELAQLFGVEDVHKRGKLLEVALNRLFKSHDLIVTEAFTLKGTQGEGVVEQVDGVIRHDGHHYFVEMKWWASPVGVPEISEHLVRLFGRAETRGLFVSASNYTAPAIAQCREALQQKVIVLATLKEIVQLSEMNRDLKWFIDKKTDRAITHKEPWYDLLTCYEK
jgi:restriction system protein